MKWCKDILTDYDNQTYDTGRVIAVFLVLSMTILEIFVVAWRGQPFDAGAFGGGMAAVLACLGAAIAGDNHRRPGL